MNSSNFYSPSLSVVIRVFNSQKTLPLVLEKLSGSINPDKIICVDSGSSDATVSIIRNFGCRLIKLEGAFGYSRALNVGFEASDTDWVICLSSHCIPLYDDFILKYCEVISRVAPCVTCVSGVASMLKKKVVVSDELLLAGSTRTALLGALYCGNSNAIYRRSAWVGFPFNEAIEYGEDLNWALAALNRGEQVAVSFSVPVAYRHAGSLWQCIMKGFSAGVEGVRRPEKFNSSYADLVVPLGAYVRRIAIIWGDRIGRLYVNLIG